MRRATSILILALAASNACGSGDPPAPTAGPSVTSPTQGNPAPPAPQQDGGPIAFSGVGAAGTSVTTYREFGFTIAVTAGSWEASSYGNPPPFIQFRSPGGATTTGELRITRSGATFTFSSVDVYSSTTPIPYAITGLRNSAVVFHLTGTVPNTFGNFRTVENPDASRAIDALGISLTNAAAPCCRNPMGVDNIDVR